MYYLHNGINRIALDWNSFFVLTHIGLVLKCICTIASPAVEMGGPLSRKIAIVYIAFFGSTITLKPIYTFFFWFRRKKK